VNKRIDWNMIIVFGLILLFFTIPNALSYEVQTINESNIYISVQTYRDGSGFVYNEFRPKSFSSNVDIAYGFDMNNTKPLYLDVYRGNYINITYANSTTYNITLENWTRANNPSSAYYSFDNRTHWHVFNSISMNANTTYRVRIFLNVTGNGKYDVGLKPSAKSMAQAIADGQFYYIDPVFNLSANLYSYWKLDDNTLDSLGRYNLTNTGSVQANVSGKIGDAYNWTGGSQFLRKTDAVNSAPLSICSWFRSSVPFANGDYNDLFRWADASTSGFDFYAVTGLADDRLYTQIEAGGVVKSCNIDDATMDDGNWHFFCSVVDSVNMSNYLDGSRKCSIATGAIDAPNNDDLTFGSNFAGTENWAGAIDEIGLWSKKLNESEISDLYNAGVGTTYPFSLASVTFQMQVPPDVNSSNIFKSLLNVTYNYSGALINNTAYLNLSFLNSSNEVQATYLNGTSSSLRIIQNSSFVDAGGVLQSFQFYGDNYIHGSYNFNHLLMSEAAHLNHSIGTGINDWVSTRIFNLTAGKTFNILEIMLTGGTIPQSIYYCNESSVQSPQTNPKCGLAYTIIPSTQYDHCHGANNLSCHYILPLSVVNGAISGVKVTNTGYFYLRGGSGWNAAYIANVSRADTTMTSANGGATWTNFAGTIDAHVHQFSTDDKISYFACGNFTILDIVCSSVRTDNLDITALPPNPPQVFMPTTQTFDNANVTINYTNATSAFALIVYYSIDLLNADGTLNQALTANNTLKNTYVFNSSSFASGSYFARVTAHDNETMSASGYSELFTISNSIPVVPATTADAISAATTALLFGILMLLAILAYFFSFYTGQIGSMILKLIALFFVMASALSLPEVRFRYGLMMMGSLIAIHLAIQFILTLMGEIDG